LLGLIVGRQLQEPIVTDAAGNIILIDALENPVQLRNPTLGLRKRFLFLPESSLGLLEPLFLHLEGGGIVEQEACHGIDAVKDDSTVKLYTGNILGKKALTVNDLYDCFEPFEREKYGKVCDLPHYCSYANDRLLPIKINIEPMGNRYGAAKEADGLSVMRGCLLSDKRVRL